MMRLPLLFIALLAGHTALAAMDMFSSSQDDPITIESSSSLKIDQENKVITAIGRPKVIKDDVTVEADEMIAYYEEINDELSIWRIDANENLYIVSPQAVIHGHQGTYDAAQGLIIIQGGEEKIVHIIADDGEVTAKGQVEYYELEHKVIARENVVINAEQGEIQAEVVEVLLAEDSEIKNNDEDVTDQNNVELIKVFDNVTLTNDENVVTADRGLWDPKQQKAIVLGSVTVVQSETGNILKGCRAEIDFIKNITFLDNQGCEDNAPITGKILSTDINNEVK